MTTIPQLTVPTVDSQVTYDSDSPSSRLVASLYNIGRDCIEKNRFQPFLHFYVTSSLSRKLVYLAVA
jgi:hypothetical protein